MEYKYGRLSAYLCLKQHKRLDVCKNVLCREVGVDELHSSIRIFTMSKNGKRSVEVSVSSVSSP